MTIYALINELHSKKIRLWEEDGQLKFKAAKGAMTSEVRDLLIRNKDDIVVFLKQVASARKVSPIRPADRASLEHLPLSFSQERLWFISQLDTGNTSYSVPLAARIGGDLSVEHVEQAMNLIIARHENLRTIFPGTDGQARQVVLERLNFRVRYINLGSDDESMREQHAREICAAEAETPFDLAHGPLIRGLVIRMSAHDHVVMFNMHHIVSDGWSMGVLLSELGASLDALKAGRAPALFSLPIQYLDYAVWQRSWLEQGGILKQQLDYWRQKLAGVPESLSLATDFARPAVQSFVGRMHRFGIDATLTEQLKRLADARGATLYMVLLAAYKALLHRYTGQEDICLGSAIANRQYGETEALIGMFVNTLALRTQVRSEDTFCDLLAKVKKTCLEAYENQDAPFDKVVDAVLPHRNIAINPIYQIILVLQNAPLHLGDNIDIFPLEYKTSNLDQIIEFTETPDGLRGLFEFSTALFKPETIDRIIGHFIAICRSITARPEARIGELEYLSEAQKRQLLVEFNDTRTDCASDQCIHELFAAQVANDPGAVAVVCEGEKLTYGELQARSRELALYLQSLGVGPDNLVGLCVERSLDMVVGIMGILEAGGAYVPLDPTYPDARLEYMLQDSKVAIVVTQQRLKEKLSSLIAADTQLIAADAPLPQLSCELRREVRSNNLAYVIYTSGSTGEPKGAMVEHRNCHRLFTSTQPWFNFNNDDVIPVFHSYSFDFSVWEMFCGLVVGASIVVVPDAIRKSNRVVDFLIENRVTVLNQTPSAFYALSELLTEQNAPLLQLRLRLVIFAGEALNFRKLATWVRHMGLAKPQLVNMYGITETTVHVSYYPIESIDSDASIIGIPLPDLDAYVLDRHNNLLPVGMPGELHVAGDGLARGYLHRRELTAQRFVPNPFVPGKRMYKSGDLARWLDNGTLEYLGRIDTQVKIRGYRIETGEIEARLNEYPGVRDSVVVVHGQEDGRKLVAFYLMKAGAQGLVIDVEAMKCHLRKSLPDYMVPADFVKLESIPLTGNGKVDRQALERMQAGAPGDAVHVGPRNPTEERLAAIWAHVLNLDPRTIGVHDNFFERGGNSLLAVRLMAKINASFGCSLHLVALFTAPHIAGLAQALLTYAAAADAGTSFEIVVPMQTRGNGRPIFAMPGADGNALALQKVCAALGTDQPFYGLQAVGLDGKAQPLESIESTAQANVAALKKVQPAGPYRLLGYSYGGVVAYEVARLLLERGDEVESLMLLDTPEPVFMQRRLAGSELTMLVEGCKNVGRLKYGVELRLDAEQLRHLPIDACYEYMAELFTREHGIETTAENVASTFRLVRAAERCLRTYTPPGLPRPIDVFLYRATEHDQTLAHDYGWNEFLPSPIDVIDIDANHYSMVDAEVAVRQIARSIGSSSAS